MEDHSQLFSEIALDLHAQPTTETTVDLMAACARDAVSCDDSGIMIVNGRRKIETVSATSDRVRRAHDLQVELGEGPFRLSVSDEGDNICRCSDLGNDARWPNWGRALAELGFGSMLAISLNTKDRRYGSLALYWNEPTGFDEDAVAVASIFARHAAIAVAHAHQEAGLLVAIDARKVIGQAQGILMERFDIDSGRAFDVLRRYSQQHNAKLRDVAQWVIDNRHDKTARLAKTLA